MGVIAAGGRLASGACAVAGALLVASAWTIPYVVELVAALVLLYAGLVLAGAVPGRRLPSAAIVVVALIAVQVLPPDLALPGLDRVLHVSLGIVLAAVGLRRAWATPVPAAVPS